MAELIQPVKGMNDVLADQAPWWAKVESVAHELFAGYGYQRVYLPVLERTELFSRSIGELTDIVSKEMFTFDDYGDSLTLRPEGTAGVVRAALSNGLLHNQQQKLWLSGPMFRREKPQKGRYRQFHQMSVEALGFAEPEIDAELIALSARLWRGLELSSVKLELNTIGTAEARQRYKQVLVEHFTQRIAASQARPHSGSASNDCRDRGNDVGKVRGPGSHCSRCERPWGRKGDGRREASLSFFGRDQKSSGDRTPLSLWCRQPALPTCHAADSGAGSI